MMKKELVIIGGGPAGMSAAVSAYEAGVKDILILERESRLGGILKQCIHNGFGLHKFGEELTGPEYAYKYEKKVHEYGIPYMTETTVLALSENRVVTATNSEKGVFSIEAGAVILAMGCRERSRGAVNTAGTRPAGVYSAGTAQKYVNIDGLMPGKTVVILGSGDIGLIMARRMTLEGAKVKAVCEILPYSGGLSRNIVQCLNDFDIPLKLSHTILKIHGEKRVTGVTIAKVDEKRNPIPGTEEYIECDTVLYSVGLIPENELTRGAGIALDRVTSGAKVDEFRETEMPGVFSCGNVLHVHDLVDYVSEEAEIAGKGAVHFLRGETDEKLAKPIALSASDGVRYTVPQRITESGNVSVFFRVADVYKNAYITVKDGDTVLLHRKKTRLAPGEMERLELKKEWIDGNTSGNLHFSLDFDGKEGV